MSTVRDLSELPFRCDLELTEDLARICGEALSDPSPGTIRNDDLIFVDVQTNDLEPTKMTLAVFVLGI